MKKIVVATSPRRRRKEINVLSLSMGIKQPGFAMEIGTNTQGTMNCEL
jgi:hypothetical protein